MAAFELQFSQVDDHTQQFGTDIRPVLQVADEKDSLHRFFGWASDRYPSLFETAEMSRTQFSIKKLFIFPGKGQIELRTFTMTSRGPVFIFPHKVVAVQEELEWPNPPEIFQDCLDEFRKRFPVHMPVKVGVVHERVFNTGDVNSTDLLASCVPRFRHATLANLTLKLGFVREGKNVKVDMESVRAMELRPSGSNGVARPSPGDFGLRVRTDVNNAEFCPLDGDAVAGIVRYAAKFDEGELLELLNGGLADATH